ncbi:TPA: hypothetical protein STX52_003981, partial [Clostridioides difficile]|nr:hypothetical protein [Clostridioides difficile]
MKMRETSRAVDKKLLVNNNRKKFQSAWLDGDVFGSAEKENERFINSAEGKIIKLKESLKQLVTDTISTDMFKTS